MRNFKMTIAYDGTRYFGWEHQPGNDMTIQGKLEAVLSQMTGAPVTVIGAGRTDAGVHARAMTANVLLDTDLSELQIQQYLNRYLPDDISVNEVRQCADRFHARFKAIGKTYRYTLWYAESGEKPVFERKYTWVLREKPDVDRMREAAEHLVGEHDFKSFCGNSHMKKSTVRVVDNIQIVESGNTIRLYFHGSGFLQNMVRILTGTLLEAGYGRLTPEDMDRILEARDRKQAGPTAPPQGLCLMKVDY
ncbi:MAG: tRNA pseudouridine(38-40) synthase TruA [Lachnospiraceae bacterium]|jgi:tRNA pseudouridine38-40 synthase|nr:tRNA pseudouridine(38-40) synthase TruA [Lachnospiraceae bacterium]MCI1398754.1 tRNA pseudouridine(38-40) synthase TruA [Lachnospiraceae bacterium]MCI1423850.1 tRNA pseudouridine(38-40) synthase TruA [Lachnospiraceae bacterium]MCI1452298.1 tRNA pseudouridine(38-40) synthase TruA [Lachnospiraceae bacterium]MDD5848442.1 tRNA pseudouridine(38-40) synthase TruA [Bacillota bacterium]